MMAPNRERPPLSGALGCALALGSTVLVAALSTAIGVRVGLRWAREQAASTAPPTPRPSAPPSAAPESTPRTTVVQPRGELADWERTTVEIFRETAPSVVFITTLRTRWDPFRRNIFEIPAGTGSGIVWDRQGHVVTNFHVIQGASGARVTLEDGSVWPARLVGSHPNKDLAVLHIEAPPERLRPVSLGTSRDLVVGQAVFAVGNPFGLDHTLSTGVVSGLDREIRSVGGRPIYGAIQTDAAINPGNSGGPLLDSAGRLIGINTMIYSPSGASAGVGFAIPVDTVVRVVDQLVRFGRVVRPVLGVRLDTGHLAARLGVQGVVVLGVVPGGPAARAGVRPAGLDPRSGRLRLGDVIVGLAGRPVPDYEALERILDELEPGQQVELTLDREGERRTVQVRLAAAPAD